MAGGVEDPRICLLMLLTMGPKGSRIHTWSITHRLPAPGGFPVLYLETHHGCYRRGAQRA